MVGSPRKKRRSTSRPVFWVVVALGALMLGLAVWLLWPIEEISMWKLIPSEAFLVASFDLSSDNPGVSELLGRAKEVAIEFAPTWKGLFLRGAFPFLLPKRLTLSLSYTRDVPPRFLVIADVGRKARVIKLLAKASRPPLAYSTLGGSMLFADDPSFVEEAFDRYASSAFSRWTKIMDGLVRRSEQRDGFFLVDNRNGVLSELVRRLERRFEFAAFPSVDAVTVITGYIDLRRKDVGSGSVSFFYKDRENVEKLSSDVKFIYGAVRRKLKAYDMDLRGKVRTEPGAVRLDFELRGIAGAAAGLFSPRGGKFGGRTAAHRMSSS